MASVPFSTSAAPTQMMVAVGLDFAGVQAFARKAIKLLQDHGDEFLSLIDSGFRAFKAVTSRDFLAVFVELNKVAVDLAALIAAIKAEFQLP